MSRQAIQITAEQAKQAYAILIEHGGANPNPCEIQAFVHHVTHPERPCTEYRFMGLLGFGGKFRNNENREGVPYVDYYREHKTPAREEVVRQCNAALAELFRVQPHGNAS